MEFLDRKTAMGPGIRFPGVREVVGLHPMHPAPGLLPFGILEREVNA